MDQKNTGNFQKQIEQNTMKTYLNRLQNNDAIFDEVRYPTGFPELDKALSGGLVAGLHCIGAISSLGKTTFVLQMAENMASTGIPVIIFSLETEVAMTTLLQWLPSKSLVLLSIPVKQCYHNKKKMKALAKHQMY